MDVEVVEAPGVCVFFLRRSPQGRLAPKIYSIDLFKFLISFTRSQSRLSRLWQMHLLFYYYDDNGGWWCLYAEEQTGWIYVLLNNLG